jgi:hypothetical protein
MPAQAADDRASKKYAHSSSTDDKNAIVTLGGLGSIASLSHRSDIVVDFLRIVLSSSSSSLLAVKSARPPLFLWLLSQGEPPV